MTSLYHILTLSFAMLVVWAQHVIAFAPRLVHNGIPASTSSLSSSSTSALHVKKAERFDMEELRQRINQDTAPQLFHVYGHSDKDDDEFHEAAAVAHPDQVVHVIVFHPGTSHQGAHTIEYPKGSGNNVLLAFFSEEACQKFAEELSHQVGFPNPTPCEYRFGDLSKFCDQMGVFVQVVPEGVELRPPSQTVKHFGHNPELRERKRHLEYLINMNEAELEELGVLDNLDDEDELYLDARYTATEGAWE